MNNEAQAPRMGQVFGSCQLGAISFDPKIGTVLCYIEERSILPDWYDRVFSNPMLSVLNKLGPKMIEVKSIEIESTELERSMSIDAMFIIVNKDPKLKFRISADGAQGYKNRATPEAFAAAIEAERSGGEKPRVYFTDIGGLLKLVKSENDTIIESLNEAAALLVDCTRIVSTAYSTESVFLTQVLNNYKKAGL
jgi:hypothetical protein